MQPAQDIPTPPRRGWLARNVVLLGVVSLLTDAATEMAIAWASRRPSHPLAACCRQVTSEACVFIVSTPVWRRCRSSSVRRQARLEGVQRHSPHL